MFRGYPLQCDLSDDKCNVTPTPPQCLWKHYLLTSTIAGGKIAFIADPFGSRMRRIHWWSCTVQVPHWKWFCDEQSLIQLHLPILLGLESHLKICRLIWWNENFLACFCQPHLWSFLTFCTTMCEHRQRNVLNPLWNSGKTVQNITCKPGFILLGPQTQWQSWIQRDGNKICDVLYLNWFWLQIVTLGNSTLGTYFTATSTLVLRW